MGCALHDGRTAGIQFVWDKRIMRSGEESFEKDTLTKETNAKKTAALTKLYKSANAADSVAKLLISGQDLEKLELDDKGELKNGTELLKKAKADYADLFGGSGNTGVPQANPDAGGNAGNKTPQTVY